MVRTKNGGPMTEPTAADRLSETLVLPAKGNLLTLAEKGVAKVRADRRDQRTAPSRRVATPTRSGHLAGGWQMAASRLMSAVE